MDFNERELFKKFQLDNINAFKKYLQEKGLAYDSAIVDKTSGAFSFSSMTP